MQRNLKTVLVSRFDGCYLSIVLAQRGSISGTVVEARHRRAHYWRFGQSGRNHPRGGVAYRTWTVNIPFRIFEPGTYDLQISYITYTTQLITGVEVRPGEITRIDVELREAVAELSEVVISAEMILNNESALLRHRQNSNLLHRCHQR